MDIGAVNSLSYEDFIGIFGNVVEKCPLITAAVWSARPFSASTEIEACIVAFIDSLPTSGKEGILRCHPDLAGRDLESGTLTPESKSEQRHAGLTVLDPMEIVQLRELNSEYKERFGFPFVICARLNDKTSILRQLKVRLENDRTRELALAIDEVKKICRLRLESLINSSNKL